MSKIKKKIGSVEHIYKFPGGKKKLYKEKGKIKASGNQTDKLVISKEFEPMFKHSVITLFSDINNYTNTLECQFCHKEIQDTMAMNYFHLHNDDSKRFITFHFLCALKSNKIEEFQEIMGSYDYRTHKYDLKAF